LLMREIIAVFQRLLAAIDSLNETAFIVEILSHNFLDELIRIAAPLSGRLLELGFNFGCEVDFHGSTILEKRFQATNSS
jgi:Fe2+ transport system protein FeoA